MIIGISLPPISPFPCSYVKLLFRVYEYDTLLGCVMCRTVYIIWVAAHGMDLVRFWQFIAFDSCFV